MPGPGTEVAATVAAGLGTPIGRGVGWAVAAGVAGKVAVGVDAGLDRPVTGICVAGALGRAGVAIPAGGFTGELERNGTWTPAVWRAKTVAAVAPIAASVHATAKALEAPRRTLQPRRDETGSASRLQRLIPGGALADSKRSR